nr:unnamed protein product [Callosobruchus chinensis]
MNKLGKARSTSSRIVTTGSTPVCFRPYRISESDKIVMRNQVQELLSAAIIQLSKSEYASPALLLNKKDGYVISVGNVSVNNDKDKAVINFPIPRTVHQLRQFLG